MSLPVVRETPMDSAIDQYLNDIRQQKTQQTGSLIVSLFGDAVLPRGGGIWLGSLIRLLEPLGMNERLVRTAVFRLVKEGWLETETHGRRSNYRLTPSGRRRFEEASRHIYASNAPTWDRRWRLILVVGDIEPKDREQLRRALFWQGFGALGNQCFVHPGADLAAALDTLAADGMEEHLKQLMPLMAADIRSGLAAGNADLVGRAWDLSGLAGDYRAFVDTYRPLLDGMRHERHDERMAESAFLLRVLLIHDYRRLLLRDPELPDVLLPAGWPGHEARLLCKDIYRRLWAPSEFHLEHHMRLADDTVPAPDPHMPPRFPDDDSLGAVAAAV